MPYKDKEKEREYNTEYKRGWRKKHKLLRICAGCSNPAVPGQTMCILHSYRVNQLSKRYHQEHRAEAILKKSERMKRRELEGRCNRCGTPLVEGEGKRCVNCIFEAHHPEIKGVLYAVNQGTVTIRP